MTWGNPPKFIPDPPKRGKKITPEMLAGKSEDSQQAALFAWAADSVGKYPQLRWLFAIPNGGSRHIAEATKFVATGTRSGVPDLMLPVINLYAGCFIEMKVGTNKASKNQLEWLSQLSYEGYYTAVCYSWQEARDVLINYLEGKL